MYDLHTHSHHSDGELSPSDLVAAASMAGVQFLALTDHDTVSGIAEAQRAAQDLSMRIIPGVEISTRWHKHDIHVVGLNIDPTHPILLAGLELQGELRRERVLKIAEALTKAGCKDVLETVRAHSGTDDVVTRAHFAQYLLVNGYVTTFQGAFKKYLGRGKPAYVATDWVSIATAIEWIRAAGGVAVLAHPARYELTSTKIRELVAHFKASGGQALEVVTSVHSPNDVTNLTKLTKQFELHASMGSDYHGSRMVHARLGGLAPMPGGCTPVWRLWEDVPLSMEMRL